jgi:hypothetical protein
LGIKTSQEEIAQTALLVDILTGVIKPEDARGELRLSMYSLIKAAEAKGVVLKGANVTLEQLKASGEAAIAYLEPNHYVVIKELTDTGVIYIDNGQEVTNTKEEFEKIWKGDVLILTVPTGAGLDLPVTITYNGVGLGQPVNPGTFSFYNDGNAHLIGETTGVGALIISATKVRIRPTYNGSDYLTIIGSSGRVGIGTAAPNEILEVNGKIRADTAFNLNGTDGVTQVAVSGKVCDVTALAGGIATAQTQVTPIADGTVSLVGKTSITFDNGRVTALS